MSSQRCTILAFLWQPKLTYPQIGLSEDVNSVAIGSTLLINIYICVIDVGGSVSLPIFFSNGTQFSFQQDVLSLHLHGNQGLKEV